MLNDHDLAVIGLLTSGVLLVTTLTFAIAWVRARERSLRARMDRQRSASESTDFVALRQAVDTIAVEVERISEGQRFVTKRLADQADQADQRSPDYHR